MAVELDVTFYEPLPTDSFSIALTVSINLTSDDPTVRARFATMAREMEENAAALLELLTEEPNGFDSGATGGSNG